VCFHKLLFLAILTTGSSSVALAQGSGTVHGTVILPSGAPVSQALVSINGPGAAQSATTNGSGEYNFTGLDAGEYRVSISAPGFERFEVRVTLSRGGSGEADAVLVESPKVAEPPPPPPEGAVQTPSSAPAPAQTTSGAPAEFTVKAARGKAAVYGYITDQSNAVIPNGTATVTGRSGPVTVSPNARGQYVINGLAPGTYKVTVNAEGFAPFESEITLTADQSLEIDAQLQPPSEKTSVNVEASNASNVETESSHIEGTITEKEVLKTPLNGRNFTQLIALQPGVSNQTGQDEALVGVKGSVKYSVNGGRVEYNNFDVDGSDVLNAGLNGAESTLMVYPSLDAIQEVKVLTSNYGAMYGRSASGTVLVTTKAGTKQLHGSLYDFVRNEFFNARNYFDQTTKAPLYRRQDFGGTIGGPLSIPGVLNAKDKTFFFWSEEFRLEKSPQEFNQAVPTLPERGIGVQNCPGGPGTCADFSDVCPLAVGDAQPSIDRALYPDCPSPSSITFPGNLVPIDQTSAALLNTGMIPLPNSTVGCNSSRAGTINSSTQLPNVPCYDVVISPATYWREELGRFDHDFSQSTRLSFRYIHDSWNTTVATPEWGYVQNNFPTVQNKLDGPGTSMVVRLTNTISPSLLNEFVVSYVNAHITLTDESGPGANLQPIADCAHHTSATCVGYIFDNGEGGKPPGIVIGGTNAEYGGNGFAVDPSYMPWEHTNPTYGLSDNVSKAWGHHTVQWGVQLVEARRNETNGAIGAATGDLQGILTFSNQNTGINTGNAFSNLLIGPGTPSGGCISADGFACVSNAIKSYQQDSSQLRYHNDYWIAEPYVQDDWRVNPRLTVNLGVRLSLFGNFHERNLTAYNWESSAFSATLASTASISNGNNGVASGALEVGGKPVPLNPSNPSNNLNPVVTNGLVQCGTAGTPASCMTSHEFNPAPRIGFAWDPKGDGKTSLRFGYGVFFEHGTAKEANTGSLEGSAPLVLTMTDPFPSIYSAIGLTGQGGNPVAFPLDVTSIPTKTIWPYVQQWSFSVQRQLIKNTLATVAYVGSKGTHLTAELQQNQLPAPPTGPDTGFLPSGNPFGPGQPLLTAVPGTGGQGDCSYSNGNFIGPGGAGINGITVTPSQPAWVNMVAACFGIAGSPNPNSLRPYLGFQRILSLQNIADSQYHAFQATLRHTHGALTLGASYTFSHSLDDSSDRSDASFVNSANIRSSWASSNFDQRHLLNFNYVYDLPKMSRSVERWLSYDAADNGDPGAAKSVSSSNLLRQLLDGWQISGITVFQSGTPFSVINGGSNLGISVLDNAGVANGAGTGSYPDVVGNPRAALGNGITRFNSQSIGPLLYNPAAFAAPRGLTFGDTDRNFLTNPHRLNFDLTGLKNFKITENSHLEFRAEAFNIFNHTEFRIFNPNFGNTANNTISCYAGALSNYSAAGGYTTSSTGQPTPVNCATGSSFLHPIDAHRPRTLQLGLKYSF
jgi:hypothetical protein